MLVNPTFATPSMMDPGLSAILAILSGSAEPKAPVQLAKGVYEIEHFNGEHEVDRHWWVGQEHRDYDASYPVLGEVTTLNFPDGPKSFGNFGPYGVCDSFEQIFERCPEIVNDSTRGFFVFVTRLRKDEQSSEGGWRWHKWGEYIGTQEPTCEYLYDEPVIEQVYTFHVYEVKNPESLREAGVTPR